MNTDELLRDFHDHLSALRRHLAAAEREAGVLTAHAIYDVPFGPTDPGTQIASANIAHAAGELREAKTSADTADETLAAILPADDMGMMD